MKKVTIVGGGLVGSLLAVMMAKRGFQVEVYERRPDIRDAVLAGGKSINLAISDRGWRAVELVGITEPIREIAIPMYGRKMHAVSGEITDQPYGLEGQAIYSISRGGLNARMLDIAESVGDVKLHFNERCVGVDFDQNLVLVQNEVTGKKTTVQSDLVFGTDGAFSAVRSEMQTTERFNYQQDFLPDGYREILLPANEDGSHKLHKNALHIWPRGKFMLIGLANLDGSFTCTLFMPYEGETSFASLTTVEAVNDFFKTTFPDFYEMMPSVGEHYFENPLSALVTIRCFPWVRNKVALVGDAAHAMVPFYGQGMNAGFEDCTVLFELMDKHGEDWKTILSEYQSLRKPDGDAIATLAIDNFYVMRDYVGDEDFLLRKKIEKRFYEKYPKLWMPLYSQVTFSHIRYSEAIQAGKEQDAIMDEVMKRENIHQIWGSDEIENQILSLLKKSGRH